MRPWFNNLIIQPTDNVLIQLFRYSFVGGIAFAVDFGMMILLTEVFGFHYLLSATISFLLGLATNYALSLLWVFHQRNLTHPWVEFLIFSIIGVIGLGMNDLIMFYCTDKIGAHYTLSKIIATAIVFFWNFFARKHILFNKAKP